GPPGGAPGLRARRLLERRVLGPTPPPRGRPESPAGFDRGPALALHARGYRPVLPRQRALHAPLLRRRAADRPALLLSGGSKPLRRRRQLPGLDQLHREQLRPRERTFIRGRQGADAVSAEHMGKLRAGRQHHGPARGDPCRGAIPGPLRGALRYADRDLALQPGLRLRRRGRTFRTSLPRGPGLARPDVLLEHVRLATSP